MKAVDFNIHSLIMWPCTLVHYLNQDLRLHILWNVNMHNVGIKISKLHSYVNVMRHFSVSTFVHCRSPDDFCCFPRTSRSLNTDGTTSSAGQRKVPVLHTGALPNWSQKWKVTQPVSHLGTQWVKRSCTNKIHHFLIGPDVISPYEPSNYYM